MIADGGDYHLKILNTIEYKYWTFRHIYSNGFFVCWCVKLYFMKTFLGILPEVTVPMQVVTDALVEMTGKKELFLGYMSSMITGDQGT